jgi:nucleoredoxin
MKSRLLLLCGAVFLARAAGLTLDEVVADPQLWPKEVTVTATTKARLIKDGQPAGMMLIGAGKHLIVSGIAADGVMGKSGGVTIKVAVEQTDLLHRLGAPAATAAAAAPEPVAAAAAAPAPARRLASAERPGGPSVMQRRLAGKLVRFANGSLEPVDAAKLAGVKYYGLYYSASWCGPCRQFTPEFIKVYKMMKQQYPEFEVVFVSADHSAGDMKGYMRDDGMPWLALKYDEAQREGELTRYCGPGIPCLVLVDPQGRVLSDSFEGDNYVGPGKVLQDATRLLAANH